MLHSYVQANCQCRPVVNKFMNANKTNSRAQLDRIYEVGPHGAIPVVGPGPYSPIWQVYPPGDWASIALFDLFSSPASREALNAMISTRKTVLRRLFTQQARTYGASCCLTQIQRRSAFCFLLLCPVKQIPIKSLDRLLLK